MKLLKKSNQLKILPFLGINYGVQIKKKMNKNIKKELNN